MSSITTPTDAAYVPADIDATDWAQIEPLVRGLLDREVRGAAEMERWLLDRSDLEAAVSEAAANLYIAMTCDTDDEAANAAYLRYIESVPPRLKPLAFELDKKQVALSESVGLDPARYAVLDRSKRAQVTLFRQENVPLQTELDKLGQEYSKVAGAMTVEFDGKERTLPQMAKYMESPDRGVRESAWRAVAERRQRDRDALNDIYDKMIQRRDRVARNAGFAGYTEYAFVEKERFDYTPKDCERYWEACEKHVVPFMRRLDERRRAELGVDPLRPWDLAVDPKGRPPLSPFDTGRELLDRSIAAVKRLDPRLGEMMARMDAGGDGGAADGTVRTEYLDLDSRKGKRPGGYMYVRDRSRKPFIFMNAAGVQRDVVTMVHEAGHAFHSMLCADEPLLDYRAYPTEFAEVASMSMEHLTRPYWGGEGGFYHSAEDLARAQREHLEGAIEVLAWIATIDAFQHWIYANPAHTREQRDDHWLTLDERFGHRVSWEGLEELRRSQWQRQGHLFSHPHYYIEYGIAQLGALQMWLKARQEGERAAVDAYMRALTLGGSRPLPELFQTAGLTFDFGPDTVARLVDAAEAELESLPT